MSINFSLWVIHLAVINKYESKNDKDPLLIVLTS